MGACSVLEVSAFDLQGERGATNRLWLEPIVEIHAAALFPLFQTEQLSFIDRPKSLTDLQAQYRRWSARRPADGTQVWLNWAARLRARNDYVGWFQASVFENRSVGLAYVIFPHHWRRGYATEGCRWMMDHLRCAYSPTLFFVEMDRRNDSSIALAEKLGFIRREDDSSPDEFRYELHITDARPAQGGH